MMNSKQDIDEQAARWVAGMLSGDQRTQAQEQMAEWQEDDPRHADAVEELVALTQELDTVGEAALQEEFERELFESAESRKRSRWIAGIGSIAASFVVAAFLSASLWMSAPEPISYQTGKGQRSTIALADGSLMYLNTDTQVTATLEDDLRHIKLERGEAYFDVKRDESRPFVVDAGATQVQVLGTKFNVRLGASSNVVSVLSGLVAVSQRMDKGDMQEIARLHIGEQAAHDTLRREAIVEAFDQDSVMAWRSGKVLYHETPLAQVVEDLNRYFKMPLQIADPALSELPVTGTFNLTDQNVVIDALESAFSIRAVKRVDGTILLYARKD